MSEKPKPLEDTITGLPALDGTPLQNREINGFMLEELPVDAGESLSIGNVVATPSAISEDTQTTDSKKARFGGEEGFINVSEIVQETGNSLTRGRIALNALRSQVASRRVTKAIQERNSIAEKITARLEENETPKKKRRSDIVRTQMSGFPPPPPEHDPTFVHAPKTRRERRLARRASHREGKKTALRAAQITPRSAASVNAMGAPIKTYNKQTGKWEPRPSDYMTDAELVRLNNGSYSRSAKRFALKARKAGFKRQAKYEQLQAETNDDLVTGGNRKANKLLSKERALVTAIDQHKTRYYEAAKQEAALRKGFNIKLDNQAIKKEAGDYADRLKAYDKRTVKARKAAPKKVSDYARRLQAQASITPEDAEDQLTADTQRRLVALRAKQVKPKDRQLSPEQRNKLQALRTQQITRKIRADRQVKDYTERLEQQASITPEDAEDQLTIDRQQRLRALRKKQAMTSLRNDTTTA